MYRYIRTSRVRFVDSLSDLKLSNPFVAICDKALPPFILDHFPQSIRLKGGEDLKSLTSIEDLATKVLSRCADRSLTLVAVGGGSIGDAVGFLASILWRGVPLIHVPTTLLSMVDSAHGGKTAVNLSIAKNQLGTFYPAFEIWIVRSILERMPKELIEEGLTEIVKAALIGDVRLTKQFLKVGLHGVSLASALTSAISVKQKVCEKDPFESKGIREILNFGHTLGHALEITTKLPHGRSVAWGLACAILISKRFGLQGSNDLLQVIRTLLVNPKKWPLSKDLIRAMLKDKKRKKNTLRSVVLTAIGKPIVTDRVVPKDWVEALLKVRKQLHV